MKGLFSLVLSAGWAGLSLSLDIPSLTRVFDPEANNGTTFYKASNLPAPACPTHTFLYEQIAQSKFKPETFVIPHTLMVSDNVRCGKTGESSEHLWVIPGDFMRDSQTAVAKGLGAEFEIISDNDGGFYKAFSSLVLKYKLFIGIEMNDRYCGGVLRWKKNSLHIFMYRLATEFDFGSKGWISPGESAILSWSAAVEKAQDLCIYKNSTDPGLTSEFAPQEIPEGSPLPLRTPVASPSPFSSEPLASPSSNAFSTGVPTLSPSNSLSPTPSEEASADVSSSPTPDDGSACFPASSLVELDSGLSKRMDRLSVGDNVRVGPSEYSPVFMFTHKLSDDVDRQFWNIQVESGHSITATTGHYIFVNGALKTAESIEHGDILTLASGKASAVTEIKAVEMKGLYNPQTEDGRIVVDGISASTYTRAVDPTAAHGLLAPLRFLYRYGLLPKWGLLHKRSYELSAMAPTGVFVC